MANIVRVLRGALVIATALAGSACGGSTEPKNGPDTTGTNTTGPVQSTGRLSVWTDYDTPIAVTIDGSVAGSTTKLSSAPTCGQTGTVTVTIPTGSHTIAGSGGGHAWSATTTVSKDQCTMYKLDAPAASPPPATTGQLSIWTDYTSPIALTVDGTAAGNLSTFFASAPTCGQTGTVTLTTSPGSHRVTGLSGGTTWDVTGVVTAGQCTLVKLSAPSNSPPPGSSTGQIAVWSDYPHNISVNIDGAAVGTLTSYFTGPPVCGQSGTLTLTLPAGTHVLNAASGSTTWNGNVTITAGQCLVFKLSAPAGGGPATGQISVWSDYSQQIAVRLDGTSAGNLTSYFTGTPTCGQNGTLTLTVSAGTHTIGGLSGSVTWTDAPVTVAAGQCVLYKLAAPAGGGGSTGRISFWTNYPYNIDISVDGVPVGTTTSYFTGQPTCGQTGTITVARNPGTHTVSARSGTVTWNGTLTVTAGGCLLYQLAAP